MDFQSRKSTRKSKDAELQNGFLTRVTARLYVDLKFLRVATCIPIDSLFLPALAWDLLRFCCVFKCNGILKHPEAASDSIDGEYVEQIRGRGFLAAMELTDDAPSATGTSLNLILKVVRVSEGEFERPGQEDRGCLNGEVSTKNEQDAQGAA